MTVPPLASLLREDMCTPERNLLLPGVLPRLLKINRRYARIHLEVPVFFSTSITVDMPVILDAFHGLPHGQSMRLKGATVAYPQTPNRGPLTGPPAA